jgi:hypothetical protein
MVGFLHFFTKGIFRALEGNTQRIFFFALLYDFSFCSSSFAWTLRLTFCTSFLEFRQAKEKISAALKTLAENFGTSRKLWRFTKTLALHENLGGLEKLLRKTSAPDQNLGGSEKLLRKTSALDQNLGGFEKLLRKTSAPDKNLGG